MKSHEHEIYLKGFAEVLSKKIDKNTRARRRPEFFRKSGGKCWYCGDEINMADMTIDHFYPRCSRWFQTNENKVCCCGPCNTKKDSMHPIFWFRKMEKEGISPYIDLLWTWWEENFPLEALPSNDRKLERIIRDNYKRRDKLAKVVENYFRGKISLKAALRSANRLI